MRKILFLMLFALVGVFVVLALTSGADAEASTLALSATSQSGQQELPLAQGDGNEASVADVSPVTEVGVCGNGVAVGSVGTQAGCSGDQQTASGTGDDQDQSVFAVAPVTEVGVCGNGVAGG